MAAYEPRIDDMMFILTHVAGLDEVAKLDGHQDADPDTVRAILEEAGRFFAEVMAPLNRTGDEEGSVLTDAGTVRTPEGFKEAYRKYVESGWSAAHMPEQWGGGGMPYVVGVVIEEMFKTANMAFSLAAMLTHGAVEALQRHGSEELKAIYIEKLVNGEWTGTMNLTEPEAGSDLGAVRTKAIRQDDGSYRLFGTKIFITWGDQDLTENIIHLVLARTTDAVPGTRGISMFLVPKFILDENGEPGEHNDLKVVSLEHKLGIHASPTCVISYGDEGRGAVGYLVGDEQEGMRNMFTMMNLARIGVGMEGVAIGERAYQQALGYARERVQGREIGSDSKDRVAIIEHPDVRRMLLTMQGQRGGDAIAPLCRWPAKATTTSMPTPRSAGSWPAIGWPCSPRSSRPGAQTWGWRWPRSGLQVHGGMGYIEETGAAQFLRDSRIAPIYEGTNGIQAIDLVLRKIPLENGAVVAGVIGQMTAELATMEGHDQLSRFREELSVAVQGLAETSRWLGERLASGDLQAALAGASPYLRQFGIVLGGWLMARTAVAAIGEPPGFEHSLLADKVTTARFYGEQLLPMANGLAPAVKGGAALLESAPF